MHQNWRLEGMYAYAKVQALGIVAIGKSKIRRKFMHQNWPLEGMCVIYKTVLALSKRETGKL
jgi:hypothetical protein